MMMRFRSSSEPTLNGVKRPVGIELWIIDDDAVPMVGSPAVAGWIAQLAFWVLLTLGAYFEELGRKAAVLFVVLWAIGYFGLPRLSYGAFVAPYTAVLDIALVWLVFKRDVRLS
jgi:hypothetical protein